LLKESEAVDSYTHWPGSFYRLFSRDTESRETCVMMMMMLSQARY